MIKGIKIHPSVKEFLAEIGRKGGSAGTEAQKAASRENGKKGGRPKGAKNKKKKRLDKPKRVRYT